jgi:hypothetical protein
MMIHRLIVAALISRWTGFAIVATLVVGLPSVAFGQHIAGTVTGVEIPGIQGIQVTFFDAANAETLGSATTNFAGAYDSGLIPAGNYRVRFSDPVGVANPGSYAAEFFGAAGADAFCSAAVVPVLLATTTIVNQVVRRLEPTQIAEVRGGVAGVVRSAATGAPLGGIEVRLFDATNASLVTTTQTNADGTYAIGVASKEGAPVPDMVRVRFFDPTGIFFPQFFVGGAAGPDDFCAGALLFLRESPQGVDAFLELIPPAQQTENLTEAIEALNLPSNVESMLRTPLVQAVALLNDANSNNDAGVCAQLNSFISRINIQESRGQLSPSDASALRGSTAAILAALGCQ